MKKLKLNLARTNELLSREQMKKISGGYGGDGGHEPPSCLGNACAENDSSACGTECGCESYDPGRWFCFG
jgi:hypothetical protein